MEQTVKRLHNNLHVQFVFVDRVIAPVTGEWSHRSGPRSVWSLADIQSSLDTQTAAADDLVCGLPCSLCAETDDCSGSRGQFDLNYCAYGSAFEQWCDRLA